ncbi:GDP-D-glucose phosphorylase 1-like [Diadema antillarum]|uniref:GDP-D-glucose phosphorylase 1-like n=1 Tax=Diadema antillarum TaxID=105358 RepID=UPI003A89BCA1
MNMASVFKYSSKDFVSHIPPEAESREERSTFDKELLSRWDEAAEKGFFRYLLGNLPTRVIEGSHGFVAQLNIKRATDRRVPQEIKSTKQPFKPQEFNFNKVKPHEILMELSHEGSNPTSLQNGISHEANGTHTEGGQCTNNDRVEKVQVIINISPLEYGNVLLVPRPELCQPQIATLEMIQIGVETLLLSSSRSYRIGYNSLCAFASVNHLHMHAYYVDHRLPIEYMRTREVIANRFHETVDWPAQSFMLALTKKNYKSVIRDLFAMVKLLQDKDIAHNMFFSRGLTLGPNPEEDGQTVRLLLWPRLSSYGVKASDAFNGACCELGGHLPVKREERFNSLTEKECCKLLQSDSLQAEEYERLKADMKNLLQQ